MITLTFNPDLKDNQPLTFNAKEKRFSAYLSDLDLDVMKSNDIVEITNEKNGNHIHFVFTHTDTDGEDTYGWNYKSVNGAKYGCELLLIND